MLEILYKTIKEKKPSKLEKFRTGSLVILEKPTEDEIEKVTNDLKLSPDIMEDAKDVNEVPRIEKDGTVTYIFTRIPYEVESKNEVTTYPVMIAIGEKFVCCVFHRETKLVDKIRSGELDYATTQKTKLLFQIMSEINESYRKFIIGINKGVRRATVDFESIHNRDIVNFVKFESTLNDFIAALVPTNNLLNRLLSGRYIALFESDEDLVEDNLLANSQLIESSKSTLKNIVNIRGAYSTILTNNLNRVIRFLTMLTVLLTVPTIIASLFGMNVALPFADNPMAFWIILLTAVILAFGMFFIFTRSKWMD